MTIEEISGVVGFGGEVEMEVGPVTQALFRLRTLIGRILGWDEAKELVESVSFISRMNEEDRTRSLIVPGKPAGISRILYQFENETHAQWYLRQLLGSANISGGPVMGFLTGNLSYQIEHHLFPRICHVRYRQLSPIIESVAAKHGVPCHSRSTLCRRSVRTIAC